MAEAQALTRGARQVKLPARTETEIRESAAFSRRTRTAYIEPAAWSTRCGLNRQEEGANYER